MLIVDELKKNDPQLRLVAVMLVVGLFILLAGLWWVQVVSVREYQAHLDTQAYRTIRIPAVRGKILDREGRVLAENRPRYNLSLYFDDLNPQFTKEFERLRPVKITTNRPPLWQFWAGGTVLHTNRVRLKPAEAAKWTWQARYNVVDRIVSQTERLMGQDIPLDPKKFMRSYEQERAMPFTLLSDLNSEQIARFQENYSGGIGADLEMQSIRNYPQGTAAAHVLGELREDDSSIAGEESFFDYRLPDYRGVTGIESTYNSVLHGRAGEESVTVNNMGYRQAADMETAPVAGENVYLTLDLDLQRVAEQSLVSHQGNEVHAAIVVMDVRNGDVLALVSSPTFDPNDFAKGITPAKYAQVQELQAEKNRATQEEYAPASAFKVFTGLAALEAGLNPEKIYTVEPNPSAPGKGAIYIGRRRIEDLAPPGPYDFKLAIKRSSNSYFIQVGLQAGADRIVTLAKKFHFGDGNNLPTRQETKGNMPTLERIHHEWGAGDTANMCIGQGEVAVTPLQIAVAYSAIANGGTVYWPRLVSQIEPQDPTLGQVATNYPTGVVRDRVGVSARNLQILYRAMLAETEDPDGTGKKAYVPGLHICGKTGTAQVQDSANRLIGHNYWFASFAPYDSPKYAVVVMVESPEEAGFGGTLCAPIAHDIYSEILRKETGATKVVAALNPRERGQN